MFVSITIIFRTIVIFEIWKSFSSQGFSKSPPGRFAASERVHSRTISSPLNKLSNAENRFSISLFISEKTDFEIGLALTLRFWVEWRGGCLSISSLSANHSALPKSFLSLCCALVNALISIQAVLLTPSFHNLIRIISQCKSVNIGKIVKLTIAALSMKIN